MHGPPPWSRCRCEFAAGRIDQRDRAGRRVDGGDPPVGDRLPGRCAGDAGARTRGDRHAGVAIAGSPGVRAGQHEGEPVLEVERDHVAHLGLREVGDRRAHLANRRGAVGEGERDGARRGVDGGDAGIRRIGRHGRDADDRLALRDGRTGRENRACQRRDDRRIRDRS